MSVPGLEGGDFPTLAAPAYWPAPQSESCPRCGQHALHQAGEHLVCVSMDCDATTGIWRLLNQYFYARAQAERYRKEEGEWLAVLQRVNG